MSEPNLLTAGVEAVTRFGSGSLSMTELLVSKLLLCAVLIELFAWNQEPVEQRTPAWPPPEELYWGK